MKNLKKFIGLLVVVAVLATSVSTAFAALPAWVFAQNPIGQMKVVVEEEFDGDFNFSTLNGYADGTWERFRYSADDAGRTVSVSNGKLKLTPGGALIKSGVRYNFPAQDGAILVEVKATRISDAPANPNNTEYYGNELKFSVRYDKDSRCKFESHNENWNRLSMSTEKDATGTAYFYVKKGDVKAYSLNADSGTTISSRDIVTDSTTSIEAWDSIELFSMGASYEIDSVKIYSFNKSPFYLNENFETFGDKSKADLQTALRGKGYTVSDSFPNEFTVVNWDRTSYAMRMGTGTGNEDSINATVEMPLPNDLPSEFFLKFRMKNHSGRANFSAILSFDGKNGTAGSNDFVIQNSYMNYDKTITYDNDKVLDGTNWYTCVLHVKGTSADVYAQGKNETEMSVLKTNVPARSRSNAKNYLMLTGAAWVDDIQLFAPGVHILDFNEGAEKTEFIVLNAKASDLTAKALLGGYDGVELMDVQLSEDVSVPKFGALRVQIPNLIAGTAKKMFFWEGLTNLKPITEPINY